MDPKLNILSDFASNPLVMVVLKIWERVPFAERMMIILVVALLVILAICALVAECNGPVTERHVTGVRLARWKQLAKKTVYRDKKRRHLQIMLGQVPWPAELERRHALINGTSGAGKSTIIRQILPRIRSRGERAIIVDLNGDFAQKFFSPGDRIFNPLDHASVKWNPLGEIKEPKDIDALLQAMVPRGTTPDDEIWRGFARDLLKALMRRLHEEGELRMDRLKHYAVASGDKEMAAFLQGGATPTRLQENSMVSNSKSMVKHFVESWDYAPKESNFSIADWVRTGTGFIFITPKEDERQAIMPLTNTFINMAVKTALSPSTGKKYKPIALVIDELSSFEFDDLQGVLEKGRKFGLVAYAGIQNISQLRQKYGIDGAKVLMSCFSTKVIFNPGDAETADEMADEIGEHVVERLEISQTRTAKSGSTTTRSWRRCAPERLILATDLRKLRPLHAYVKFAGDYDVAKITVSY
jgi:type IV secretory pathway TraG/TraD family ATPase VirD4